MCVSSFCLSVVLLAAGPTAARKPNIVLLYADDLGWTDLGCFGSRFYETPNLDRLAAQGMRLTAAYACAGNCAPSRACLMTGQYVPRHGVYTVGPKRRFDDRKRYPHLLRWDQRKLLAVDNAKGIPAEKITVAEALKNAGYATAMFGKWHLGGGPGQSPREQGFDVAIHQTGGSHWKINTRPPPRPTPPKGTYRSDWMTDRALEFIDAHRDRPFFLYLPDYLVHVPLEAKQATIEKYKKKSPAGYHHNAVYAAMIEHLDHSFGRVLTKLDKLGLTDKTLVVFYSDNGGVASNKKRGLEPRGKITSNHPLRGMKGMLYEGGIRVPMIVRWPGHVPAGSVSEVPVIGVDFYPTFLALAGTPAPEGQPLDGESLLPLVTGKAKALRREAIFWHMPGYLPGRQAPASVIRCGDFKLIENYEDGSLELYNLRTDVGERTDLAASQPQTVRRLHGKLQAWRTATDARIPKRNPKWVPKTGAGAGR